MARLRSPRVVNWQFFLRHSAKQPVVFRRRQHVCRLLSYIRDGATALKLVRAFARCKAIICEVTTHLFCVEILNTNIEIRGKFEILKPKSEVFHQRTAGSTRKNLTVPATSVLISGLCASNLSRFSCFMLRVFDMYDLFFSLLQRIRFFASPFDGFDKLTAGKLRACSE